MGGRVAESTASAALALLLAAAPAAAEPAWHTGSFRYLPAMSGDLVAFVAGLPHPNSGGYVKLGAARAARFEVLLSAIGAALDATLADPTAADWCGVRAKAAEAGYGLSRYFDTVSGRWLLHGRDTTGDGQAYFFINPYPKMDIVLEAPHEPFDANTSVQGARILRVLPVRAILINKEHRCSASEASACDGMTGSCGGGNRAYPVSDVAHHTANTFHLMHRWYSDRAATTKFAQLHGMASTADDRAEIADCTTRDVNTASVSLLFAENLRKYVPTAAAVHCCQEAVGAPPSNLCASANVQGRYTNQPTGDACSTGTSTASGRFLHIEQGGTLRDDDPSDGWYWGDVRDALRDTWPACGLNDGAADCSLGAAQSRPADCACGAPCDASPYGDAAAVLDATADGSGPGGSRDGAQGGDGGGSGAPAGASGCGCGVARRPAGAAAVLALVALGGAIGLRRRRCHVAEGPRDRRRKGAARPQPATARRQA